jgi:hypothetical protein
MGTEAVETDDDLLDAGQLSTLIAEGYTEQYVQTHQVIHLIAYSRLLSYAPFVKV